MPARRIRGRAEASGLAQQVETDRPLPPPVPPARGLGRDGGISQAVGAPVGRALPRLSLPRLALPSPSRTRVGQAWRLPAQPLGSHGKQGLEKLDVVARAVRGSGPGAPAAGTRAPPQGRAPGTAGTIAGGFRPGGLATPRAGRGPRRCWTGGVLLGERRSVAWKRGAAN